MDWLHHTLEEIARYIDLIGIAIVLYGFVRAAFSFVALELSRFRQGYSMVQCQRVRLELGTYILIAIEFMIASDIIHTVITREFTDLIFVGLLVLIRTAISFFLGREIIELQHEDAQKAATT